MVGPFSFLLCKSTRHYTVADKLRKKVQFTTTRPSYTEAEAWANECQRAGDVATYLYYQRLLQTANGRYTIRSTNLNEIVNQNERTAFQPVRFREWLGQVWGGVL